MGLARATTVPASAFEHLDAPRATIIAQPRHRVGLLPRHCGTYALHDRDGRLLYIGKARNARLRVMSHLRSEARDGLLPSWTPLIAHTEVRCAGSETEALLVEADLVARFRPPCNRDMRRWDQYCYLAPTGEPRRPLRLVGDLPSTPHYGPFRSRRQAAGVIRAVRHLAAGDMERLQDCYAVLSGRNESLVRELEAQVEADFAERDEPLKGSPDFLVQRDAVSSLRSAFDRARLLEAAKSILNGLLILPAPDDARTIAVVTGARVHLALLEPSPESAESVLGQYRAWMALAPSRSGITREMCDALCVGARRVAKDPRRCRLIPRDQAAHLLSGHLLVQAFGASPGT